MKLSPKEEALHLEVKALKELKPADMESMYIYAAALNMFFDRHTKEILDMLDKYLTERSKHG